MSTSPSRFRSSNENAKRAEILAVATDLIIERGYEGTNLVAICERAACSKTSIYHYFGNKEGLLRALTEAIALEISQALHAFYLEQVDVEAALQRYSRLALRQILDERHIAIVRATIAAVWKYPQLGPTYYELGALTAQSALAQYFDAQSRDGVLDISDTASAAKEFQGLLLWDRMLARLVGVGERPDDAEIEAVADAAVRVFLDRYRMS